MTARIRRLLLAGVACFFLICTAHASAALKTSSQEHWIRLVQDLTVDGFDSARTSALFQGVDYDPEPMRDKMHTLYVTKFGSGLVRDIQARLALLAYDPGPADGIAGAKTRAAIRGFQSIHGLEVDGRASEKLLTFIEVEGRAAPKGYAPPPPPPAEGPSVYRTIITPERLAEAKEFHDDNRALLAEIEDRYGIPPEITVAILTVETRVGKFLGNESAFRTLASMAVTREYEDVRPAFVRERPAGERLTWLVKRMGEKADWAYAELKALLFYAAAKDRDPRDLPGSIYGAIGISQFMPSNALRYGVDGNADGVVDLFDLPDALHSMGNYLKGHGWRQATTPRAQRKVIYRYNKSVTYVNTVMAVADHLR
jgi:membrane-bound lytic murein transglycosylase B